MCKYDLIVEEFTTIKGKTKAKDTNGVFYRHIVNFTPDMQKHKVINAFTKAFAKWGNEMYPLRFEATSDPKKANFKLHFEKPGSAKLPKRRDGTIIDFDKTTLAYAIPQLGVMYFNEDRQRQDMFSSSGYHLQVVAEHEIGHLLYLGHTTKVGDIMFPNYGPNMVFTQDVKDAIAYLYGTRIEPAKVKLNTILKALFPTSTDLLKLSITQLRAIGEFMSIETNRKNKTVLSREIFAKYNS